MRYKKKITVILLAFLLFATPCFAGAIVDYNDANCQGAWLFEDNNDPESDSSQNTNTAAYQGDPTWSNAGPAAAYSNGYYILDQVVDSFDVADTDSSLDISGDFSLVAWIYPVSYGDISFGRIFDKEVPGTSGYSWYINNNSRTDGMTLNMSDGSQSGIQADQSIITTGIWQHVAVVFDDTANTATFYVNGVAKGSPAAIRNPTANAVNATIGDRNDNARQFDGRMDEMAFFDRTLSEAEVNDLFDNGLAPTGAAAAGQIIIINN